MRREEVVVHEGELYLYKLQGSCIVPKTILDDEQLPESSIGDGGGNTLTRAVVALQQLKAQGRGKADVL
jgi:hypothetical protein